MNAATKKGLVVVSVILLIGGIIAYAYSRRKGNVTGEEKPGEGTAPEKGAGTSSGGASTGAATSGAPKPKGSGSVKPKPSAPAPVQVATQQIKLADTNKFIGAGNTPVGKLLYSVRSGIGAYNIANNMLEFSTSANQFLGTVYAYRKNQRGVYILLFTSPSKKQNYWIIADGTGIKTG